MVEIPPGRFWMGSNSFYRDEGPVRRVEVAGFAIDRAPVTVAQFARFVDETGYVTLGAGAPERPEALVGLRARRLLAPSLGAGQRQF